MSCHKDDDVMPDTKAKIPWGNFEHLKTVLAQSKQKISSISFLQKSIFKAISMLQKFGFLLKDNKQKSLQCSVTVAKSQTWDRVGQP